MARCKVVVAWSSGKDSAWTLQVLRQDPAVEVVGLLTTLSEADDAVTMHGVPRDLLRRQALNGRVIGSTALFLGLRQRSFLSAVDQQGFNQWLGYGNLRCAFFQRLHQPTGIKQRINIT